MRIHYEDVILRGYIQEIEELEDFYNERRDLLVKEKVEKAIKAKNEWFDKAYEELKNSGEDFDDSIIIDDYQEFASKETYKYYLELSSYFQKAYAVFENQIAESGKRIDFSKYPKVEQMNWAVNVLKHAKGKSYDNLVRVNSKFVQKPVEFSEMYQYYLPTGEILNLEFSDLTDFLDEVKTIWQDCIKENQQRREQEQIEKQ